nr:MAG TPA: hypothetical protein [Caudoviricetes sp.]
MNLLYLISSDFGHCFYYCKQKTASLSLRLKQLEQYFRNFPFYFKF